MSDGTTVTPLPGLPGAVIVESETAPEVPVTQAAAIEGEIALAEIHSETAIELAEIEAETERARIAAFENERENSWQERAEQLQAQVNEITGTLSTIAETMALLIPPPLPNNPGETITTTTISSVTAPETLSPDGTESQSESAEESPAAEAAAAEAVAEAAHERRARPRMI